MQRNSWLLNNFQSNAIDLDAVPIILASGGMVDSIQFDFHSIEN
jgi:hypothetical protein